MLYIVATPIGNRADITFRAIEVLKACDLILCEDTRHSKPLLKYYGIETRLQSYHKFSEAKKENQILDKLREGTTIGLISDAGTPTISDPGQRLVAACHDHNLPITTIPGASAAITALASSGFPSERFQFVGFLPKKPGQLQIELEKILAYDGTTICYESPHRIKKVLKALDPNCLVFVAREMTKKFETLYRGKPEEVLEQLTLPKGEIVLIIAPNIEKELNHDKIAEEFKKRTETMCLSRSEVIRQLAKESGISKNKLYSLLIKD